MDHKKWDADFRYRTKFFFVCLVCLFLGVVVRQVWLQHFERAFYDELAAERQKNSKVILAPRGDICDRNGSVLATSSQRRSIGVHPYMVKDPVNTAKVLSEILNMPAKEVYSICSDDSINHTFLKRKASDQECDAILEKKYVVIGENLTDQLPGIVVEREDQGRRFYPKGDLAAHLLGMANVDGVGIEGMEAAYDYELSGVNGKQICSVDVVGINVPVRPKVIQVARPGLNLVLTLDETIQFIVETELARTVREFKAAGGVCVVMDAKTAEILAMATCPEFDPDRFPELSKSITRNRAATDNYEPGSIFKCFLAATALENGYTPSSQVYCPAVMYVDGNPINNADDGFGSSGSETLSDILAYSFNTGTANTALALGREILGKKLQEFGFNGSTGSGIMGEAEGLIGDYHDWSKGSVSTISFGQGVAVTPVQLCSAMQAVANKGVRMQPSIVRWVKDREGKIVSSTKPKVLSRPMSEQNARNLLDMMTGVVTYGTGKRARVPGYLVAGKTGTAQIPSNGRYLDGMYNSGFLGVAPADDPRIVVLVKIEKPTTAYYGGLVAGPVFSRVCSKVLPFIGVPPKAGFVQRGPNG